MSPDFSKANQPSADKRSGGTRPPDEVIEHRYALGRYERTVLYDVILLSVCGLYLTAEALWGAMELILEVIWGTLDKAYDKFNEAADKADEEATAWHEEAAQYAPGEAAPKKKKKRYPGEGIIPWVTGGILKGKKSTEEYLGGLRP